MTTFLRLSAFLLLTLVAAACSTTNRSQEIPTPRVSQHDFTIGGRSATVYAIPTGTIQIKQCHFSNCLDEGTSYPARLIRIFFSRTAHSERLPIYTFLIRHPDGYFLVDAGGDRLWNDDESWRCDTRSRIASRALADVQVPQNEDLLGQLRTLGVSPKEIHSVVVTHLHFDHTASLRELDLPTFVGGADIEAAGKIGAVPCRFLDGVKILDAAKMTSEPPSDLQDLGDSLFGPSVFLTTDGSLRIYSTPGHTPGSLSIRLRTDQGDLWFIGDISFSDSSVSPESEVSGMHFSIPGIRDLHAKLSVMVRERSSLLVPSHDKNVSEKIDTFIERSRQSPLQSHADENCTLSTAIEKRSCLPASAVED